MIAKRVMVVLVCTSVAARAEPPGDRASVLVPQRIAYIAGLLDALRTTEPAALANTSKYIAAVERNNCQSPEQSLRVGCLLEAAAQNCKQTEPARRDQCLRVSDVVITNRLSEQVFVPKDLRYEIMNKHGDYRTELQRELHRRYATLVAEFSMSARFPGSTAEATGLATGIEGYCRDTSGARDVSWQYCVAAVVWFIGTEGSAKP